MVTSSSWGHRLEAQKSSFSAVRVFRRAVGTGMGPWSLMNTLLTRRRVGRLLRALRGERRAPRDGGVEMARLGSTDTVVLGQGRRMRLEAMVARPTTAQRTMRRAKIVLAAWRGRSN